MRAKLLRALPQAVAYSLLYQVNRAFVGTHKAYDLAKKMGKPTMFVVTKLDDDNANFNNVLTQLKAEFDLQFALLLCLLSQTER